MKSTAKKVLSCILVVVMLLLALPTISVPAVAAGAFAGGDGSPSNPYKVSTPAQLNEVRFNLNKCFIQIGDIDLGMATSTGGSYYNGGQGWDPIGTSVSQSFSGVYDGGNYKIIGLKINKSNDSTLASLFGNNTGTIRNVGIVNISVSISDNARSVNAAGIADDNRGTISNCYTMGQINVTGSSIGSTCGGGISATNMGTITNCYNVATISVASNTSSATSGGIAAINYGTINQCYNMGSISANCNSTSNVIACAGGISGVNYDNKIISNCYNIGDVSSYSYAYGNTYGGIVRSNYSGASVLYCYCPNLYGSSYGTQMTLAQMKNKTNFLNWNFNTIWAIDSAVNGGYPYLRSLKNSEGVKQQNFINLEIRDAATKSLIPDPIMSIGNHLAVDAPNGTVTVPRSWFTTGTFYIWKSGYTAYRNTNPVLPSGNTYTLYLNKSSGTTGGGTTVQHLDSWNYEPNVFNKDLAIDCSIYSMLAYDEYAPTGNTYYSMNWRPNKPTWLQNKLIVEQKFECVQPYNYADTNWSNVSFTLAKKDVNHNGERRTLVAVIIRGTDGVEWQGNMDVTGYSYDPTRNAHYSFDVARANVYLTLEQYLSDNKINNALLLVTGHSRGAAVANLLAYDMTQLANNPNYGRVKKVYGYTFATPNVTKNANKSVQNIFNFCSNDDFVPQVPLKSWGYDKHGVTFSATAQNISNSGFKSEMNAYILKSFGRSKPDFNYTATQDVLQYMQGKWSNTEQYYNKKYALDPVEMYVFMRYGVALAAIGDSSGIAAVAGKLVSPIYNKLSWFFVNGNQFSKNINDTHQAFTYYSALKYNCFNISGIGMSSMMSIGIQPLSFVVPTNPNATEVAALKVFAQQGDNLQNLGWDLNDISTWDGVEWSDNTVNCVIRIDVSYKGLTGILDVSNFTELRDLNCSGNYLSDIIADGSAVLENIDCAYNGVNFLSLIGCDAIKKLNCSLNSLTTLNISAFINLTVLSCEFNNLTTLNISTNTNIEELYCAGNSLTSLDLSTNTVLTSLDCSENYLDVYENASMQASLAEIESRDNGWVRCESQKILIGIPFNVSDIAKLSAFAAQNDNLTKLGWNLAAPQDWSGVEWIKTNGEYRISRLDVSALELTGELDVSEMPYLTYLSCNDNGLSSINASDCSELTYLSCNNSGISRLNVANTPSLAVLNCGNNYLDIYSDLALEEVINNMLEKELTVNYAPQKILADKRLFNKDEYDTLLAFAELEDNLTELEWNIDRPGEWAGITWGVFDAEYRVVGISMEFLNVAGGLDLSSFDKLTDVDFKMTGITSITLPKTVSIIADFAFYDCSDLEHISLPDTLLYIGSDAFYNCTQMSDIVFPEGMIAIGDNSFRRCSALDNIIIPDSTIDIGNAAFYDCESLNRITFMGNAPSAFGDDVFTNTAEEFSIFCYDGQEGWATPTWNGWSTTPIPIPLTDEEAVAADKTALTWSIIQGANTEQSNVTANLAILPLSGVSGTTITWKSTSNAAISDTGIVTRPAYSDGDATVTLTATISKGNERDIVSFDLIVLKLPAVVFNIKAIAGIGGFVTGDSIFNENASITLSATPNDEYIFDGWYENNVKVNGAGATYTFIATANRTLEARFTLIVNAAAPNITTQPTGATVNVGGSANLTITATKSDAGTLTYQWYSNTTNNNSGGTLISEATGTGYSAPTTTAGTKYYYCVVTNTNNSVNGNKTTTATSNVAAATVNTIVNTATPSITSQPIGATVNVGATINLSIAATKSDAGTLTYQWYSNTTNSNSGGTLISGATGTSYSALTRTAGTKYYYCVVTNTNNSVNGNTIATVTSNVATVRVNVRTYTVTFKDGKKTLKTVKVDYNKKASSYNSKKSGYTFIGWYTGTNYKIKFNFGKAITGNTVMYAYFAKNPTKTASFKAAKVKSGQIKTSWKLEKGYTYVVEMSTSKTASSFKAVKTTTSGSYTKTKLTKNKTYYFRVKRYKMVKGVKVYSGYTAIKQKKA